MLWGDTKCRVKSLVESIWVESSIRLRDSAKRVGKASSETENRIRELIFQPKQENLSDRFSWVGGVLQKSSYTSQRLLARRLCLSTVQRTINRTGNQFLLAEPSNKSRVLEDQHFTWILSGILRWINYSFSTIIICVCIWSCHRVRLLD